MSNPTDPGLHPQRTDMAWHRTILAIVVGSLISLRLLPPVLGTWAYSIGAAGLLAAASSWYLARRRAQLIAASVRSSTPLPGAGLLLLLAGTTATAAFVGLLYTLVLVSKRL